MSCIKHISNTSTTTAVKDLLVIPTQLTIVINDLKPEVYLITVYISSSYLKEYTMCLYYNYHPPNIVQRNTCCYCVNHIKHVHAPNGQNPEFLNVTVGGM